MPASGTVDEKAYHSETKQKTLLCMLLLELGCILGFQNLKLQDPDPIRPS
jgi:hypothetical protein